MATGKGAYFGLDATTSATAVTNISSYIRSIGTTENPEDVDATVITSQLVEKEATFESTELTLRLKWSPAAHTFVAGVRDLKGLDFEYGPTGSGTGNTKITGTCNVLRAPRIPPADPRALTEIDLVLSITSTSSTTW